MTYPENKKAFTEASHQQFKDNSLDKQQLVAGDYSCYLEMSDDEAAWKNLFPPDDLTLLYHQTMMSDEFHK